MCFHLSIPHLPQYTDRHIYTALLCAWSYRPIFISQWQLLTQSISCTNFLQLDWLKSATARLETHSSCTDEAATNHYPTLYMYPKNQFHLIFVDKNVLLQSQRSQTQSHFHFTQMDSFNFSAFIYKATSLYIPISAVPFITTSKNSSSNATSWISLLSSSLSTLLDKTVSRSSTNRDNLCQVGKVSICVLYRSIYSYIYIEKIITTSNEN